MRLVLVTGLLFAAVLGRPASAQEPRGAVEGTVQDAQHGVLPGTTITASENRFVVNGVETTNLPSGLSGRAAGRSSSTRCRCSPADTLPNTAAPRPA